MLKIKLKILWSVIVLCLFICLWLGKDIVMNAAFFVSHYQRFELRKYLKRPQFRAQLPQNVVGCPGLEPLSTKQLNHKHVIFWNVPCGDKTVGPEYVHEHFTEFHNTTGRFLVDSPWCGRCKFETSHEGYEKADAIIFHSTESYANRPKKRNENQLYAWWETESTKWSAFVRRTNFYNIIMSYRRFHDVYVPYSSLAWIVKQLKEKRTDIDPMKKLASLKQDHLANEEDIKKVQASVPNIAAAIVHDSYVSKDLANQDLIRKKDKFSVWVVSNCGDPNLPRNVLTESMLNAGLPLIKFGKCDNNLPLPSRWDPAFFEVVSRFKFYLAFENSIHCTDYMTEKLWNNALYSGAVPVIFGVKKEDAKKVLPPKSFIHVEDFRSSNELVDFLKYLDRNATAYEEYLTWRTWTKYLDPDNHLSWKIPDHDKVAKQYLCRPPTGLCGLCRLLYSREKFPLINYPAGIWKSSEDDECFYTSQDTLEISTIKPLVT